MQFKLTDFKLLLVTVLGILAIIYLTTASIAGVDEYTTEFISNVQSETISLGFNHELDLLKSTTEALAKNTLLIETLQEMATDGVSDLHLTILSDKVNNTSIVTSNLSFIKSIGIVSLTEQLIVSTGEVNYNYDATQRPWYNEDELFSEKASISQIYTSFILQEVTGTIASFVHDPETGEPIGAVLMSLDMFKLVQSLHEDYRIADLDIFLEYTEGVISLFNNELSVFRHEDVEYDTYEDYYKDTNIGIQEIYIDGSDAMVTFVIDLDTINKDEIVIQGRQAVAQRILLLVLGITVILSIILWIILKPVFSAVDTLMKIIDELNIEAPKELTGITQVGAMAKFIETSLPRHIIRMLYYDELTGLPNSKNFSRIYDELTSSQRPFVIMMLDIRKFKTINDQFGLEVGNAVLKEIGAKLRTSLKGTRSTAVRYSGKEFIIVLEDDYFVAENVNLNEHLELFYKTTILPHFEKPIFINRVPVQIDFYAAAIVSPLQCLSESEMLNKIHVMISKSKEANDTDLILFNHELYSKYIKEGRIKACMKDAILADEFVLNYQPIVDENKKICKAEALIRWYNKELGFVPPNDFIYIAEQTRMIIELGDWIIERVAKDLATLFAEGNPVTMSINVSPIQIMEEDFVPKVVSTLNKYEIDFSYICLELTESILIEEKAIVKKHIRQLQEMGVKFALDDFGTGYSSFSYLKEYNLDIIKIDKVFVDNATEKEYAIIRGINLISQALNMQMVIEGVETQDQFEELKNVGLIQGYYFSKPLVWDQFVKLLNS